jgi:hypothetical protein
LVKTPLTQSEFEALLTMGSGDKLTIVAHHEVGIERTAEAVVPLLPQATWQRRRALLVRK